MEHSAEVFVGIDVAKLRNALALADDGRQGEVRYLGEFDADEATMRRIIKRLASKHEHVHFRSEEHTSELQSLMRISYAVFCLKKKKQNNNKIATNSCTPS